ncbi:Uncharacterised protein [uncultured archaeon]|nr:Uncharacterised protein [uncultured archaeon]
MKWFRMVSSWVLCWICLMLLAGSVLASDSPYKFEGTVFLPETNGPQIDAMCIGDLQAIFDQHVEPSNPLVISLARKLAADYPGYRIIGQVTSIYDYLVNGNDVIRGWCYVSDPNPEYFAYANFSLALGNENGCTGVGDCDDFAIVMASLIEAIGYNARINSGYNQEFGHAYTEVYLGKKDTPDLEAVMRWLYNDYARDICVHINEDSDEVWLNLDWIEDSTELLHPGGPFFEANSNCFAWISKNTVRYPLRLPTDHVERIRIDNPKNYTHVPLNYDVEGISIATEFTGLKAYVLIWPIEANGPWWVQETDTYPNGRWISRAFFGQEEDTGKSFKIVAIMTEEELRAGETYRLLPSNRGASDEAIVYRI